MCGKRRKRMKQYMRTKARIHLDRIGYNLEQMRNNIQPETTMLAVLKADGCGHGAIPVGKYLEPREYLWGFAVATLDEALVLRKGGIQKPILVLGCIFPDQICLALEHQIRITVYTLEMAEEISKLATQLGAKALVHIKLDTGMSRLGFPVEEESVQQIRDISLLPSIFMEGMFTHFSKADEIDKNFTMKQIEKYNWIKEKLLEKNLKFSIYHCSNSAAIIDISEANMDLVRAGIALYGLYPSQDVNKEAVDLKPALEWCTHVAHVKWVEEGSLVGYGGTFVAPKRMKIATLPVGYADGYPRSLSNKGYVLIHGKKACLLGRVCMDQMMVDVTEIDRVIFGDEATLVGKNGDLEVTVEELAKLSERFNYEFVCDITKRVPREYVQNGEVVEQMDYFG